MASLFGFGPSAAIKIEFSTPEDGKARPTKSITIDGEKREIPIYTGAESLSGVVRITPGGGKRLEHIGIKIELLGQIETFYDRSNTYEFSSLVQELETPGVLASEKEYPFEIASMDKQFESYAGINTQLRYFLRVVVTRNYASNLVKEEDFWVQNLQQAPEINNSIKMEVGIEECLHIEFEYNHSKYHLNDIVIGKVYFLLVRIKIKHMEVAVIRRESVGTGPTATPNSETLTKFEVMDGAPVRGESIPVRLFLGGLDLTPTYRHVNNKFSVKYYLNLVLVDEEDRRYFKQQEITLWRKDIG